MPFVLTKNQVFVNDKKKFILPISINSTDTSNQAKLVANYKDEVIELTKATNLWVAKKVPICSAREGLHKVRNSSSFATK